MPSCSIKQQVEFSAKFNVEIMSQMSRLSYGDYRYTTKHTVYMRYQVVSPDKRSIHPTPGDYSLT